MSFDQFKLDPSIVEGIVRQGYTAPTPIQEKAIPVILNGRDVLGLAQTGSGKTAAFVLPILNRLIGGKRGTLRALIIAPTRELATQIDQVILGFAAKTGLRSATIFGGVSMNMQVQKLRAGVDIIVACPGRLLDHIRQRTVNLSSIEMLVLDEADQMFDMGFFPTIKQIVKTLPMKRQSLLFSATMPAEIKSLAVSILRDPENVDIGNKAPVSTIEHAVYPVPQTLKSDLLLTLFKQIEIVSAIVFTRTKHGAKRLAERLVRSGYETTSLQGNLSQNRRMEAMEGFRKGKYKIMVATDIAARGIDISSVSHVINFDMPSTAEAYTHRIGRTGRASRSGEAFTFVTSEDAQMLRSIERILGGAIERRKLENFKYDAAPQRDERPQQPRGTRRMSQGRDSNRRFSRANDSRATSSERRDFRGEGNRAPVNGNRISAGSRDNDRGPRTHQEGGRTASSSNSRFQGRRFNSPRKNSSMSNNRSEYSRNRP